MIEGKHAYHAVRRERLEAKGERNGVKQTCIDLWTETAKAWSGVIAKKQRMKGNKSVVKVKVKKIKVKPKIQKRETLG